MGASVTINSGSAGNYGTGLSLDVTVSGGSITEVKSNSQGENYKVGNTVSTTVSDTGGLVDLDWTGQLAAEIQLLLLLLRISVLLEDLIK